MFDIASVKYVPDEQKIFWVIIPVCLIIIFGLFESKPKFFNIAEILSKFKLLSFKIDDNVAFIELVVPLLFRIAYADDGLISKPESDGLREILKLKLGLDKKQIEQAKKSFKKTRNIRIEDIAKQYAKNYSSNAPMKVLLIVLLFRVGGADGILNKSLSLIHI